MTVRLLGILLLLASCTTAPAPAPAPPSTPPPPPPVRPANLVLVSGQVVDARGAVVEGASVEVTPADIACAPMGPPTGALTDANGQYNVTVESSVGPAHEGCVLVEAAALGASGSGRAMARFQMPGLPAVVDIGLGTPPPLTVTDAEELIAALRAVINQNDQKAFAKLVPYVPNGWNGLSVAVRDMRAVLGGDLRGYRPTANSMNGHTQFEYELHGDGGRLSTVIVQDVTRRIWNPILEYSPRAQQFLSGFHRLVREGNAQMLARLMTADDVDFPVARAQKLIEEYRPQLEGLEHARVLFVGLDESTSTLRYTISGQKNGLRVDLPFALGYGDGLLWMRLDP
ncbi:MAG TPA: carboxypeptidase-like regulatory domain-containing protein [Thermoanaerobaculia bacterium]